MRSSVIMTVAFVVSGAVPTFADSDISPISRDALLDQRDARQHIEQCWVVPNVKGIMNMSADVRLDINTAGAVASAELVDKDRYASDSAFHVFADSVLQAIHNPKCSPLPLPSDDYVQWKEMNITFDARDML